MSIFFAFLACSLSCTIGYIVGRCFRDLEAIAMLQDLKFCEQENAMLRNTIETMQTDLEASLAKSREVIPDESI